MASTTTDRIGRQPWISLHIHWTRKSGGCTRKPHGIGGRLSLQSHPLGHGNASSVMRVRYTTWLAAVIETFGAIDPVWHPARPAVVRMMEERLSISARRDRRWHTQNKGCILCPPNEIVHAAFLCGMMSLLYPLLMPFNLNPHQHGRTFARRHRVSTRAYPR